MHVPEPSLRPMTRRSPNHRPCFDAEYYLRRVHGPGDNFVRTVCRAARMPWTVLSATAAHNLLPKRANLPDFALDLPRSNPRLPRRSYSNTYSCQLLLGDLSGLSIRSKSKT